MVISNAQACAGLVPDDMINFMSSRS